MDRPSRASLRAHLRAASRFVAAALVATALSPAHAAADDDEPSATPYRPSVSTPAALSAPGWLEIEAGLQRDRESAVVRRDSAPLTFKLAFTPDWGIRVGVNGWVHDRDDGVSESGVGDTGVVVKRRFAIDDASAFGLELGVLLPSARGSLGSGSGKPDWTLTGIYSADFGRWHTDITVVAARVGAPEAGTARSGLLLAAGLSRALDDRWSVGAELSGAHRDGVDDTRQLLLAASYSVSRRLVVDVGAARSLRSGTPVWSATVGFTWLAARLF
jgi:hypothetical protein